VSAPADEAREERARLATLAAAVPLMLCVAPLVLPFEDDRSLLHAARRDATAVLIVGLAFGFPLFLGAFGLWRALIKRPPHGLAFGLAAAPHILLATALIVMVVSTLSRHGSMDREPGAWAAVLAAAVVIYLLARGFRRRGFHRWAQLVAGAWLAHATFAGVLWAADRDLLVIPAIGGWLYLLGVTAAAPIVLWSLFARR
jgi:hypothetical protein